MAGAREPLGGRLADHISLGVLSAAFSRDLIEEVIAAAGKREKRSRLLPAHVMVRYVIGLGLFFGQAYEEVMRQVTGTLQSLGSWAPGLLGPGLEGALCLADYPGPAAAGAGRCGSCSTVRRYRSRAWAPRARGCAAAG